MSEDDFSDLYEESMKLLIETLTGTTFEMSVHPADTVLDIKKKIHRVEGIPVNHQNLLFRLEELDDCNRLCDVGIVNGSTLKLVLAMRGGPISTRRLSACDNHLIWKDLKELIEHTREELGDKLTSGAKVSVLVFKDGDVINLIRVIENDDGSYHSYGEKPCGEKASTARSSRGVYDKMQEQNAMLAKLSELRKKMADVSLKRNFKNSKPVDNEKNLSVGCIGEKATKDEDEEQALKSEKHGHSGQRYCLLDQFRRDAVSLLKLHESQFCDDEEDEDDEEEHDADDLEEALQVCEDSIALKEKHRGKNNFYNILFQDPSVRLDKPKSKEVPILTTFSKEARERSNFLSNELRMKLKDKTSEMEGGPPNLESSDGDKVEVLSPLYNCFSSHSRVHKYEGQINLPDVACDLDITPPTTASSLAESIAIIDEDAENEEKEVLSPIGVPCAGTVSMSKIPARNSVRLTPLLLEGSSDRPKSNPEAVNLQDNAQEICDILTGDSATSKLGLLKRWQSVDCSTEEVYNSHSSRNFKQNRESSNVEVTNQNCFLPSIYANNSRSFSTHKSECAGDLYFGNRLGQERISRSPLYRRYSQTASFSDASKSSDNHKTHHNKLPQLPSTWGPVGSESKSNCDNMLGVEPVNGTLYSFLNNRSGDTFKNRLELNPLRLRREHESKSFADEIKNLCESGDKVNKIQVNATKLENLPAIIEKKRMRCGFCNKRLNITNMYDCRCGGIFCSQHRYAEVHFCNYDYKTEGRKLLQQQNPVIVADKLNKL